MFIYLFFHEKQAAVSEEYERLSSRAGTDQMFLQLL